MRYRTTTLLARQAMPAVAGTFIIDIPITDIITALRFHFEVTRTAGAQLAHGLDAFPRIEIVDGSDVLLELSAAQMDALHFFERRQLGNLTNNEFGAGTDEFYTGVQFGRWPYDQELALDPKKFVNPQLRITYNGALYEAGATAVFVTVLADIFDELVPTPIGFLQNREFYRYTPVANAFHWVNLPTDLVIRKLIVQAHAYTRRPVDSVAAARLDEDNMKRIPFDLLYEDWLAKNRQEYGPVEQGIAGLREGGAQPNYNAISEWPVALWQQLVALPTVFLLGANGCELTCTDGGAENTTYLGRITGHCPHFCLCYPFGDPKDLNDWYETAGIGALRLRILNGGTIIATTTNRVIIQQMRRY